MRRTSDRPESRGTHGRGGTIHRFLRGQDLEKLRGYRFNPPNRVSGALTGKHASLQRGRSVEFLEYRQYQPGDPLADVDWKVFARSDRMFVKRYEHPAELSVHVLVDASASMAYGDDSEIADTKFDRACRLASAAAFLVLKQHDRVSVSTAQRGLRKHCPPSSLLSCLREVLEMLDKTKPERTANLALALEQLSAQIEKRGVFVLVSDLHEDLAATLDALSSLRRQGHDVFVFHLLHEHELDLPDLSEVTFEDAESNAEARVNVEAIRSSYKLHVQQRLSEISSEVSARGVRYSLVAGQDAWIPALLDQLTSDRRRS